MITPAVLFVGTCSFIAALWVHILVWRIIKPARQISLLGIIFIILPLIIYLYAIYICPEYSVIFSLIWHIALSSAYIVSYPILQAECPSLRIILTVSGSMPEGITAESINNSFSKDTLLNNRIEDLVNDRLLVSKNNKYVISFKGRLLSGFFSIYRCLLGLPLGEG